MNIAITDSERVDALAKYFGFNLVSEQRGNNADKGSRTMISKYEDMTSFERRKHHNEKRLLKSRLESRCYMLGKRVYIPSNVDK